ncbi:hypothetical protein Ciccas_005269 [Cichlidogyrus casuarinus]|uniref:sphingolipid 4-desaturase n=1 Tax=Cichlidogyrus casuarinus TaxID=1844966 RepID=A0ABD2Q945_9PLAT
MVGRTLSTAFLQQMGQKVSRQDFEYTYTEEPHATRRKQILEKHPEIRSLMGPDPNLKWLVLALVLFQILSLYVVKDLSPGMLILTAYLVGGTINHSLTLAIHEIAHNLAFSTKQPLWNRIFGFIANLPIGVPMSISFRRYHLDHHKFQGDVEMDMDLPTELEAKLFDRTFTKLLFILFQSAFYTLRPILVRPLVPTVLEVVNVIIQILFDFWVVQVFGWHCLAYLIGGTLLAMGLHPVAGHFISEHYMFKYGFETYSYYGILNYITFNVGYHTEHHDFPNIPGSRLPLVRKIAPEFYEDLPAHTSLVRVLYDFIMDPELGPRSRMKRLGRNKGLQTALMTKSARTISPD